jgi:hypothetical protein
MNHYMVLILTASLKDQIKSSSFIRIHIQSVSGVCNLQQHDLQERIVTARSDVTLRIVHAILVNWQRA